MGARFVDLPNELLLIIAELLDIQDKVRLSAVSSQLRGTLAPVAFKQISFTSDVKSAESALLAVRKYGQHTTAISFVGTSGRYTARDVGTLSEGPAKGKNHRSEYEGHESDYDSDERPTNYHRESLSLDGERSSLGAQHGEGFSSWYLTRCLPRAAEELLKGAMMPHLKSLRLMIYFDFGTHSGGTASHQLHNGRFFGQVDTAKKIAKEEGTERWRAFSAAVWRAVSANECIRKLVVEDWMPKSCTAFASQHFRRMLGRLEAFDISFCNQLSGPIESPNMDQGYRAGIASLNSNFFCYMGSLKHLCIEASENAPIGNHSSLRTGLPLFSRLLPSLETLELQSCLIGPELIEFIREHNTRLRKLSLIDCYCNMNHGSGHNRFPWEFFFREILASEPALVELNITPFNRLRLTNGEDSKAVDKLLQILDNAPRRRLFGYSQCSRFTGGWCFPDERVIIERCLAGGDLEAYEELLCLIKRNASSA